MIASVCLTAAMAARRLDGVVGEVEGLLEAVGWLRKKIRIEREDLSLCRQRFSSKHEVNAHA